MRKTRFYLFGLLLFFLLPLVSRAWALNQAFFSLSPPDSLPRVGETFDVDITLNTDEAKAKSAAAVLTFDPAKLSVVSLTPGALFSSYQKSVDDLGKITLSGTMAETTASFSGIGKFGTITLQGLASGSTTVSFSCTSGVTTDTNVIQVLTGANVVDCQRLSSSSISIAAAVGAPTAAPTVAPSPPPAGSLKPTSFFLIFGLGLLILGSLSWQLVKDRHGPN